MNPGDEVPPGSPGSGENICPQCRGSGKLQGEGDGEGEGECPNCGGTGKIIQGIGGA
jgi:DnaJ-class molecular chaperone